jgi:crotonobetainyl-CoA:carnitine CoA-transferase CaiB-like acyl-CoA transferase
MAPHGAFRSAGEGEYVAIACRDDADWHRLRGAMGDPPWARDARFATVEGRQAHAEEIERALEAWTAGHERYALAGRLTTAGVPAAPVQDARDRVDRDPQLAARGYFVPLPHAETGVWPLERPPFRLSDADVHPGGRIRRGPPCLGEDTHAVLRELLGMAETEMAALTEDGVLT